MYSQKKSKVRRKPFAEYDSRAQAKASTQDEIEHQGKAEFIVKTVLKRLDKNGDGVITVDELESVGLDGLPNFEVMGVEGHHYDVESGTPESSMFHHTRTQTHLYCRVLPAPRR